MMTSARCILVAVATLTFDATPYGVDDERGVGVERHQVVPQEQIDKLDAYTPSSSVRG